jgi:hypothetical protein
MSFKRSRRSRISRRSSSKKEASYLGNFNYNNNAIYIYILAQKHQKGFLEVGKSQEVEHRLTKSSMQVI